MREVTESDERALGLLAWICDGCKHEQQTLPEYPDDEPALKLADYRINNSRHNRDPRLFGIRPKSRRWEVRIAGGRHGVWIYICMAANVNEAIRLRDRALQQRRGAA